MSHALVLSRFPDLEDNAVTVDIDSSILKDTEINMTLGDTLLDNLPSPKSVQEATTTGLNEKRLDPIEPKTGTNTLSDQPQVVSQDLVTRYSRPRRG